MDLPLLTMLRKLSEFRRNERGSRERLEALKLNKFRSLVRHANRHSPYYARIVREHRIDIERCEPAHFPVLTKAELMANFDDIAVDRRITRRAVMSFLEESPDATSRFLDKYRVINSSGSSGQVGYFVYSPSDWARGLAQQSRTRPSVDFSRIGNDKFRLAYFGSIEGHCTAVTMMRSAKEGLGRLLLDLRLMEVNTPIVSVVCDLNVFRPDYLVGHTAALKVLAGKLREGTLRITPRALHAVGEMMTETDRRMLREHFNCEVTGGYSCSEHLTMGHLSADSDCMVLRDDDLIFEFYEHHSIVTNLFNRTMPLIRYKMGDILRPLAPSRDTSPYLRVESLIGRSEKLPSFVNEYGNEDTISPSSISSIVVAGVLALQMQLLDSLHFRIAIWPEPDLSVAELTAAADAIRTRVGEMLKRKRMSNVRFTVDVLAELPIDPLTRKFHLIVDAPSRTAANLLATIPKLAVH